MKIVLIITGFIILIKPVYSQCEDYEFINKEIVADTSYLINSNGYIGYIFPENYHGDFVDKEKKTFTLTKNEINLIESILLQQYNEVHKRDHRYTNYKPKKNVEKYLKRFDRQYLGFVNEENEKSAVVLLANRKGEGKNYFQCFNKVMAFGFGEFYEKNQRYFIINIDRKKLIIP